MRKIFFFISFTVIASCFAQDTSKPFILGRIVQLQSKILKEKRTLNIYLPDGYSEKDTTHYPVVYLLDGGADEDFIHVTGIYQFNNFPWIQRVPKSIIVGIANEDRKRDLSFPTHLKKDSLAFPTAGHSENFIAFIERELQPFVTEKFRTNSTKTIIGQSLGGLFCAEILLRRPHLFDNYIIISPSIWWDNASILGWKTDILKADQKKLNVYLGVGKEGKTPGEKPRITEEDVKLFSEKLKNSGSPNLKLYFEYLPNEDHATIAHQAIFNALRLIYPGK